MKKHYLLAPVLLVLLVMTMACATTNGIEVAHPTEEACTKKTTWEGRDRWNSYLEWKNQPQAPQVVEEPEDVVAEEEPPKPECGAEINGRIKERATNITKCHELGENNGRLRKAQVEDLLRQYLECGEDPTVLDQAFLQIAQVRRNFKAAGIEDPDLDYYQVFVYSEREEFEKALSLMKRTQHPDWKELQLLDWLKDKLSKTPPIVEWMIEETSAEETKPQFKEETPKKVTLIKKQSTAKKKPVKKVDEIDGVLEMFDAMDKK